MKFCFKATYFFWHTLQGFGVRTKRSARPFGVGWEGTVRLGYVLHVFKNSLNVVEVKFLPLSVAKVRQAKLLNLLIP